jgi:hypothetical protein
MDFFARLTLGYAAGFSLHFNASEGLPLEDYFGPAIQSHKGFYISSWATVSFVCGMGSTSTFGAASGFISSTTRLDLE